jgi:hypothetical protein
MPTPQPHDAARGPARIAHAPMSREQEPLWVRHRLHAGQDATSRMRVSLRLSGALRVPSFERALTLVVARHDVLRTSFAEVSGAPVQIISPPSEVVMPVHDLRGRPSEEVAALLIADMEEPIDVEQGPPYRMRLGRVADDEYIWSAVLHHLVFDAVSRGVLCADIRAWYLALAHHESEPPPLPVQYADFAIWQRTIQSGHGGDRISAGRPEVSPGSRAVRTLTSTQGAGRYQLIVPTPTMDEVRAFSGRSSVTVYTTLLAAFVVLFARYRQQSEVTVGVPFSSRRGAWLKRSVGCFVNHCPLHVRIRLGSSFRALLESVWQLMHEGHRNQGTPPPAPPDAIFAWHTGTAVDADWGDVHARFTSLPDRPYAHTRLDVHGAERQGRWELTWTYNTDTYEQWHCEQMGRHYLRLLHACVTAPATAVGDHTLIDDADAVALLGWEPVSNAGAS